MANHTYPERPYLSAQAEIPSTAEQGYGIVQRWRQRTTERKRARLVSLRSRRVHAKWLRDIASDTNDRRRIRRGPDVLLRYRAAAVRTDLLEIAALLERAHNPNPACMTALHELLASGDSPLHHPEVPVAELRATLDCLRAALSPQSEEAYR